VCEENGKNQYFVYGEREKIANFCAFSQHFFRLRNKARALAMKFWGDNFGIDFFNSWVFFVEIFMWIFSREK
jgi:hypothetical protein